MLRAALNNVLIVLLKWERSAARSSFHPGKLISLMSVSKGLQIFATPDSCITTAFSALAKHGNAKRSLTNNAQFRQAGVVLECQSVSMSLRSFASWLAPEKAKTVASFGGEFNVAYAEAII